MSRMERHLEIGATPSLPDLYGYDYVVTLMHEAGTVIHTGSAAVPLSWEELHYWISLCKMILTPWEIRMVKEMSHAYAAEYSHGIDPEREQPYSEVIAIDRDAVEAKVLSVLRSFKRN